MKAATWKRKITDNCKAAGTYREFFDPVIDTLASILEKRDEAEAAFDGNIIVEHTNKAGATNREQNPMLRLINDYNRDALAYWTSLGLTPKGLKTIDEQAMKPKKRSALAEALKELNG